MTQPPEINLDALRARINGPAASSDWTAITQGMVDAFADVTDDHQFIHVDPAAAARTPFGGTIAHGFLTLSLLSHFARQAVPRLEGRTVSINYGFDRVRFVAPVRTGSALRGHFTLIELSGRGQDEWLLKYQVVVEIQGGEKPALFADWLVLAIVPGPGKA